MYMRTDKIYQIKHQWSFIKNVIMTHPLHLHFHHCVILNIYNELRHEKHLCLYIIANTHTFTTKLTLMLKYCYQSMNLKINCLAFITIEESPSLFACHISQNTFYPVCFHPWMHTQRREWGYLSLWHALARICKCSQPASWPHLPSLGSCWCPKLKWLLRKWPIFKPGSYPWPQQDQIYIQVDRA